MQKMFFSYFFAWQNADRSGAKGQKNMANDHG